MGIERVVASPERVGLLVGACTKLQEVFDGDLVAPEEACKMKPSCDSQRSSLFMQAGRAPIQSRADQDSRGKRCRPPEGLLLGDC